MKKLLLLVLSLNIVLCGCTNKKVPGMTDSVTRADTSDIDLDFDEEEIDATPAAEITELTDTFDITAGGTYTLSGDKTDVTVTVDAGDEDVQLILDNFTLTNKNGPAIFIRSAGNAEITLKEGTVNTLADGENYNITDGDTTVDGAIFSRADLIFNGSGTLNVTGNCKHAVVSKDDLVISSGTVNVTSKKVGLNGKDCVKINSGNITVNSGSDAIRSDNEEDAERGYVYIFGGTLDLVSAHDGIQATNIVKIEDVAVNVKTGQGSAVYLSDSTESYKGIKAGSDIILEGGTYTIDSQDDCIHSNGTVSVSGGNYSLSSGDDGIHADTDFSLTDGNLTITKSYEGIEGSKIVLSGGATDITASDDGLNAAGGNDSSGMGGRPGFGGFTSSTGSIVISGGNHMITASGDGVDSNGTINITGGTTFVSGPENGGNGALDYDGTAAVSGGTFVALSSVGMAQNLSEAENQSAALVSFSAVQGGVSFAVCDGDGNTLLSFTPKNSYSCAVITSPDIQTGNTYTITVDGEKITEFTVETSVSGGGFGGPGGGGFGGPGGGGFGGGGFGQRG